MPDSKLDFISRLMRVEQELGAKLYNVLMEAAANDDWDFVKEVIAGYLDNNAYLETLDHLYSLIPGQGETRIVRLTESRDW